MTFPSMITSLRDGKAAYTPDMRGYVLRHDHDVTGLDGVKSKYDITFVENSDVDPYTPANSADANFEYSFTRTETLSGTVTWEQPNLGIETDPVAKPLVLDRRLFAALISSDWTIVDLEDAQARKTALNSASRW